MNNLLQDLPETLPEELTECLLQSDTMRIERIVSTGQTSPPGFWYDQQENEWVAVLSGEARLRFDGDESSVNLGPGDWINIPAHRRHRVEWTTPDQPTLWLAVFY